MAGEDNRFAILLEHKYRVLSDSTLSLGLQTAYLIISLVLAVGCSLLLIYLVCKKDFLQRPRHYLRCNLSVDDIIFTVFLIPTELCLLFSQDARVGQEACWVQILVGRLSSSSMFGTYFLMAVELYYFICQPLHYNGKVTTKRAMFGILAVRAFALLFGAGSAIIQRLQNSSGGLHLCRIDPITSTSTAAIFASICYLGGALAVLAIITIYCLVFKEARKQQERDENRNLWLCQTKAFKTLAPHIIVLAVQLASYIVMIALARVSFYEEEKGVSLLITSQVAKLIYLTLSSVVNPIIYGFRHPEVRRALRELCGTTQNVHAVMAPPPIQRGQDMEMAVFSVPDRGQWASRRKFRPPPSSSQEEGQLEEQIPPPTSSSPPKTQGEEHPEQAPLPGRCKEKKTQPSRPMVHVLTVQAEIYPSPPPRRQHHGQKTVSPEQKKQGPRMVATSTTLPEIHID
ncbi:olfactory receptor 6C65-like [Branchiostoma floridae x Branchiostoma japonicum]